MATHRFDDALASALRHQRAAGAGTPALAHLLAARDGPLTLERALAIAAEAHTGQTDKAGARPTSCIRSA